MKRYLRAVGRRWPLIAAFVFLAVVAASVVSLRTTPKYVSTSTLFVTEPQRDGGFNQVARQRAPTYAALVEAAVTTQRVIDRLSLDDSPRAIAGQVSVSVVPETAVLKSSVSDADPVRAQSLAEAFSVELGAVVKQLETPPGRATAPEGVTIVTPAFIPAHPTSQWARYIGMATILGLLLGVVLATLRATLDKTRGASSP